MKIFMLGLIVTVSAGLALFLIEGKAQMGGGMMGGGMMGPGQSGQPGATAGENIFNGNCSSCHPNGGNTIIPNLPVRGSPRLRDYDAFLAYIRHPTMPDGSQGAMPPFPPARISDEQARELYQYLEVLEKTSGTGGSQWGPGMRGYGPGMMRGYGMGPGMMGPGYGYGPRYQQGEKPLTEGDVKTMVENYLQSTRNPNLKLGKIKDEGAYFEAEVVTKNNDLADRILVDKKTGWMHSIY
jgi:hypothetical protein